MERHGSVIQVRQDKLEEYKAYHAKVWPEILDMIQRCNIRNYSIFYKDGQTLKSSIIDKLLISVHFIYFII